MDLKYIHGDVKAAGADGSNAGSISAIITKLRVDRDDERVIPMGMRNQAEYMDNPLIYWAHEWAVNMAAEPIGRATSLNLYADRIASDGIFAPTAKAQNIRALVLAKIVSKTSIGFNAIHVQPADGGVTDIDVWDLMEWSIVPLPSNVDASITGAKSALTWLETWMPLDSVNAGALIMAADDAHLDLAATPSGDISILERKRVIASIAPGKTPEASTTSYSFPTVTIDGKELVKVLDNHLYVGAGKLTDAGVAWADRLPVKAAADDDVSVGAQILSMLADLKDEESDDPEDAALLQTAIDAVLAWLASESAEIGTEADVLDEQDAMAAEQDRAPVMASARPKRTLFYHFTE